jgi:hypothetical protein
MIILFEVDNVVCFTPPGTDRDSEGELLDACRPQAAVIQRLREAHALGHELFVVTSRGPQVATMTRLQLDAWLPGLSPHILVWHRPRLVFDPKESVSDKERTINDLGGHVYISADPEDHVAAARAHARFLNAGEFALHGLVSLRGVLHAH